MKKCKECGREEWGFLSALNDDGYCPICAIRKAKSRYSELVQKKEQLEDKLREAEYCLDLIEVHTGSIGQSENDMNESLIAIMNICRKYFEKEEK